MHLYHLDVDKAIDVIKNKIEIESKLVIDIIKNKVASELHGRSSRI